MRSLRALNLARAALGLAAVALALAVPAPGVSDDGSDGKTTSVYLAGQLLVAAPKIQDPRFQKSVVFMISHDAKGAFGLIVNRVTGRASIKSFLKGFGLEGGAEGGNLVVHYGGPVETGHGFVLHTADFDDPLSRKVAGPFAWSMAPSAIEAVSFGIGPRRYLFALGYSGWGARQLEGEIERGDWLIAPADETVVFELKGDEAWDKARAGAGVRL
jgi:putative transcriptional regulator